MKHPLGSLLKVDKKQVSEDTGIVYLLEIVIEGEHYVKVGVTTRDIETRMCEIAVSCWKQYRYMPYIYSKRHRKTANIYKKEAEILDMLKEYRAEPAKKVSGHTEMHKIELECAVQIYEQVLSDKWNVVKDVVYCSKCNKAKVFELDVVNGSTEKGRYTCGYKCESAESGQEENGSRDGRGGVGAEAEGSELLCGVSIVDDDGRCS